MKSVPYGARTHDALATFGLIFAFVLGFGMLWTVASGHAPSYWLLFSPVLGFPLAFAIWVFQPFARRLSLQRPCPVRAGIHGAAGALAGLAATLIVCLLVQSGLLLVFVAPMITVGVAASLLAGVVRERRPGWIVLTLVVVVGTTMASGLADSLLIGSRLLD